MEKNIKKCMCWMVVVGVPVLVLVFGYWFFFSSQGYWQKMKEADREEYSERRTLWWKSEAMTAQQMLQDLTLLADRDSVLVCEACYLTLPSYRDLIYGTAQPKRRTWANLRYRYGLYLTEGKEKMQQVAKNRDCKSFVFLSKQRDEVQKDSTKDYLKEAPTTMETRYNKVFSKLGKPADEEFAEWRKR